MSAPLPIPTPFFHNLMFLCTDQQTDIVDDIPTVKFVYIQWIGESTKIMTKAQAATHKGGVEEVFNVSSSVCVRAHAHACVCVHVCMCVCVHACVWLLCARMLKVTNGVC